MLKVECRHKSLFIACALFALPLFIPKTANAADVDYSVSVGTTLVMSVSSNTVSLNLNPNSPDFSYQDLGVTVSTNNPTGYKLIMSSSSTDLSRDSSLDGKTATIPTLPELQGGYTDATFPADSWGYKVGTSSATNWVPFVSDTPIKVNETNVSGDTTTIRFAAKVSYDTIAGTYSDTLTLTSVANPTVFIEDLTTMQQLGALDAVEKEWVLDHMGLERAYTLTDSRDNQDYTLSKLKDGNVWMTQNLKLGKSTSTIDLDSTNTDVDSTFTLNGKSSNGQFTAKTVGGVSNVNNASQYYCTTNYGCYYNWYAATAGSGTSYVTSGNVEYSICPSGWDLPTGGPTGGGSQYDVLAAAYDYSATAMTVSPTSLKENTNGASTPGFLFGGFYKSSGASSNVGSASDYYTSTAYSAGVAYYYYAQNNVLPGSYNDSGPKYSGMAVRCILNLD